MSYQITYCENFANLMWGVIADSRANIAAIKDQIGNVIKTYVDSQTALVVPGVIPYKIEFGSNLVGFFGLQVGSGPASVVFQQVRPAFVQFQAQINQNIATFISGGDWRFDVIN